MTADNIGARLREARLSQGLSLRSVAQTLGVSASLISQVETNKTQPSVATLYALVSHLGISIDDVLGMPSGVQRRENPPVARTDSAPIIQRGADNPVLEMENGVRWERLATSPESPADALLVTYQPGATSSVEGKLMRHAGVEYAYLIEGELTLQLDFDTFVLKPGDSLHFDSIRPHLYSNRSDRIARGVWFVVGRREQNLALPADPSAPAGLRTGAPYGSAVDVLRAMDTL
ncbi:cupin domain-containing protein [Mycetocola sp. 2940]|uniref:cupin domain-containing protein n=1 Tax=Mycetocola sp. 2940 TaxID=3156452 RepID=UPI003395E4B7